MQNYKVEVKNHGESIEAQELFFNLGYSWFHKKFEAIEIKTPETIMCFENGALTTGIRGSAKHKQITLQELRDMVVLKRNDVNDANYEAIGTNFYKGANWYEWDASIGKWIEYVGSYTNLLDSVKPIQKEEVKMKEYLVKNAETGDYFLTRNHSNFVGAIEIPEGANKYIQSIKYPERFGFLRNGSFWDNKWIKHCDKRDDYIVLWQRESLNDKVASAEEYRQSFAKQNGIPIFLERQKFTQPEELPFVGDEPTGVDGTLAERQAQYGNFSEVAEMTQQLLTVMGQYGYEYLPDMHKEALHMICSKMARIVNGDHNHLDSWHDIGGYAKLIENNIN